MPEEYKYQEAPAGLSNVGRYLWYSCQMEMYRQSVAPAEPVTQTASQPLANGGKNE